MVERKRPFKLTNDDKFGMMYHIDENIISQADISRIYNITPRAIKWALDLEYVKFASNRRKERENKKCQKNSK